MKERLFSIVILVAALVGCAGSDFAGGGAAQQEKKDSGSKAKEKGSSEPGLGNSDKEEDSGSTVRPGDDGVIVNDKPVLGEKIVVFGGD